MKANPTRIKNPRRGHSTSLWSNKKRSFAENAGQFCGIIPVTPDSSSQKEVAFLVGKKRKRAQAFAMDSPASQQQNTDSLSNAPD